MKKGLSLLLSIIMVISMFSCLSVVASAALTLQTDTEYTVLSGEKGIFIAPEAGYYLFASNGNGSCGVSIFVEGQSSSVANWACEYKGAFYGTIYLEKNQAIECRFTNYIVGEDYITFTITKVDNPIESIEFEFAEDFAYIEDTLCYPATDDNGDHYTHYDTPRAYFFGNTLTVNRVDGTSTSYVYTENVRVTDEEGYSYWSNEWVSADGAILEFSDDIEIYDTQQEEHWGVGLENLVHVSYLGFYTTTSLPMIKNPVESISFTVTNLEDLTIIKEYNGRWEERYNDETDEYEDFYYYDTPNLYEVGNILTVNYTDGTSVDYIHSGVYNEVEDWYDYDWYSEDGELLDYSITEIDFSSNQFTTPWVLGSNNFITVEYMFKEYKIPVTIIENPVASIEFTLAEPFEYVEHMDGYWTERYNEETDQYEDFFHYYTESINEYDNALTVHYTDGTSEIFVYAFAYDAEYGDYRYGWFSDDGFIKSNEIFCSMNQHSKPWVVDGDNYVTVEYMGRECKVPVTVKANLVESIEFIPANGSISIFENTNGRWESNRDDESGDWVDHYYYSEGILNQSGNAIKVHFTNGSSSTYYYSSFEEGWINENDELLDGKYLTYESYQYDGNYWTVGGDNVITINYYYKTTDVNITIMEAIPDVTDGNFIAEVISPTECMITEIWLHAVVDGVLTIPETIQGYKVTGIESWVLYGFDGIEEINLPSSFTNIGSYTFYGCDDLARVNVSAGNPAYSSRNGVVYNKAMTKIVCYPPCFNGDLYIPAGVEELDSDILAVMGNASSITIDPSNPNLKYEDGIIYNADFTKIIKALNLPENYVMKSTVKEIGKYAFSGNTTVKTATINNTVTKITYGAFFGCSSLESVALPEGLVDIDYASFENSGIKSINLPSTVKYISSQAFKDCGNLASVSLNEGLEYIYSHAFENSGVTSVIIPNSVVEVDYKAFYNCDSLTNVVIGSGVGELTSSNFADCDSLKEFNVPANVEQLSASVISDCSSLERINVDANNTQYSSIDGVLFDKHANLLITYPDGKAGAYTVPSTVLDIQYEAFDYSKVTSIVVPEGVTSVHGQFVNCAHLTDIYFYGNIDYLYPASFDGCVNLKNIYFSENNEHFKGENGIVYTDNGTHIWLCAEGVEGDVVIPAGVTSMSSAFSDCEKITSIVIPEGVKGLAGDTFKNCTGLTEVKLPESVTDISYSVFEGCSSLKTIKLPSKLESIWWSAFEDCVSLEAIEIPASLTSIGYDAFDGCTSLKDVYFTGTEEQWNAIEIEYGNECLTNATIHFNSFMPDDYSSTPELKVIDGQWVYAAGNRIITDYTGLVNYYGAWYYVANGILDWSYTGLTNYYDTWYYVSNGVLDNSYVGLVNHYGTWYYVSNGVLDWSYSGLVAFGDAWLYVSNGVLDWGYTGLTCYYDTWYYVENGVLNWNYTGLTCYYDTWYYVAGGVLDWGYTGLTCYYDTWYYVAGGVLDWGYTGLTCYYDTWYYVAGGVLDWSYTGLTYYGGTWYYVANSVLDWSYTGLAYYEGGWFYVANGALDWNYTGLTCYGDTWYYVANGVLDWNYTGYVYHNGGRFYITNGYLNWNLQ